MGSGDEQTKRTIWEKLLSGSLSLRAFGLLAIPIAVALVRLERSPDQAPLKVADSAERLAMFTMIASSEPGFRREVVKDFPADPWSQDDAFHEKEFQRIKSVAAGRGVRLVDALVGLDDGLRAARAGRYRATVPPCRPRTIY